MYDTKSDADRYLSGSIILLNKRPLYVEDIRVVGGDLSLKGLQFVKGKGFMNRIVGLDEEDLDYTPFPLGYGVAPDGVTTFYAERLSIRAWKQGLTDKNIQYLRGHLRVSVGSLVGLKAITACAMRKKTPYKVAFKKRSFINRYLQVTREELLEYKGRPIASCEENVVHLIGKYSYLEKYLEENIDGRINVLQ